jgi:hypothetical protein
MAIRGPHIERAALILWHSDGFVDSIQGLFVMKPLRFNEVDHAAFALRMVSEMLSKVPDDPRYWIWVIISLHSSLQGFMVSALRSGLDIHLMSESKRHEKDRKVYSDYNKALQDGTVQVFNARHGDLPEPYLSDFINLFKKIQCEDMMRDGESFKPSALHCQSFEDLNNLRNGFIHFFPKLHWQKVDHLLDVVLNCLDIIDFLAFKSLNSVFGNEATRSEAAHAIDAIRETAAGLVSAERSD